MSVPAPLPLSGYRILEIGQLIAVPSAGQQLLEMGAEVIKIEPPGGEPSRLLDSSYGQAIFRGCNRGKTAIELDIKTESGSAHLRDLLSETDAVIHNLRPGTLDRLGFSFADMQEIKPVRPARTIAHTRRPRHRGAGGERHDVCDRRGRW
jgi:crotonobetainyl-CoA:carnitine CoA-transferase CaiB-like acyl-CoA transferase